MSFVGDRLFVDALLRHIYNLHVDFASDAQYFTVQLERESKQTYAANSFDDHKASFCMNV
jgi:hypothetical protein